MIVGVCIGDPESNRHDIEKGRLSYLIAGLSEKIAHMKKQFVSAGSEIAFQ